MREAQLPLLVPFLTVSTGLLDNFEWSVRVQCCKEAVVLTSIRADGFESRFGVIHVDFKTGTRTTKASYNFLRDVSVPCKIAT